MKKKKLLIILSMCLTCFTCIQGCNLLPKEDNKQAEVLIKPENQEYVTEKVKIGTVENSVAGSGTVSAFNTSNLYFTGRGQRVKSIKVKAGDTVKKGQVLITGESDDLLQSVKSAEYDYEKAEIRFNRDKEKLGILKKNSEDTEAIKDAEVNLKIQEISLKQSRENLESLKNNYNNLVIKAPYDGVITFLEDIKEGEIADGFKVLATIADPARMQIVYQGDLDEISLLKVGMAVDIEYSGKDYKGKVSTTRENAPEEDKDKYADKVIISFDKNPSNLKIGESVSIKAILSKKEDTLIVPKAAVKSYSNSYSVSILENGKRRDVPIKVGIKGDTIYEVISGLEEGQDVIVG